ncbi:MAG TPA: MOSC domain-containing protein [Dehalococcoidia bacterium]|nr:MOSC domain-containing protein [Dehalococcoidia bacterium]
MTGEVVYIHITPEAGQPLRAVDSVVAEEGKGLVGDRYHDSAGTYSETPGSGRHVTLIEGEAIESLERDSGIRLEPGESRRNITTRGVSLSELVDRELRIGEVVLRGTRPAGPCQYLEDTVGKPGTLKGLANRGGLRCEIVSGGTIRIGDAITPP